LGKTYKLQRWWITKGWTTIEFSPDRDAIIKSYGGYTKQIRDGSFRVVTPKGTVIRERKGSLQKKIEKKESTKRLTLSEMRAKNTDYFFSKSTKRFFRGSKTSSRYDRKTKQNYIRVQHRDRATAWYKFDAKTGKTDYVPQDKVPSRIVSRRVNR